MATGLKIAPSKFHQVLDSGMRQLSDFHFLGSSSLIVAGGDSHDNKFVLTLQIIPFNMNLFSVNCRNIIIWDTLLPNKRNVVKGTIIVWNHFLFLFTKCSC